MELAYTTHHMKYIFKASECIAVVDLNEMIQNLNGKTYMYIMFLKNKMLTP